MRRILITDSVTINTGDAAILLGLVELIRKAVPDCEIRIHCHFFDRVRERYPGLPLRRSLAESSRLFPPRYFWRWPAQRRYRIATGGESVLNPLLRLVVTSGAERAGIADYRWADAVVSCGGSFLTDSYFFDHVLAGYALGFSLGKRMIVLGQSIGPFKEAANQRRVGEVLSRFDLVAVRDAHSGTVAAAMGVPAAKLVVAADMAFNLAPPPTGGPPPASAEPTVGVSVRRWTFPGAADAEGEHRRYVERMAATLDLVAERTGARFFFVSTCQGEPTYAYRDEDVAAAVRERMRHKARASIDTAFNTPDMFMQKVAALDGFVGTRMHSCILSMLVGTASVNVEYEFKSRELFDRLALGDFVVDILTFEPGELAARIVALLADRDAVRRRVSAGAERLRAENAALIAPLRERIG